MTSYIPCEGSGEFAVNIEQYPSRPDGLGMTRGKTFGKCPACPRTVMVYGITPRIMVTRHKPKTSE